VDLGFGSGCIGGAKGGVGGHKVARDESMRWSEWSVWGLTGLATGENLVVQGLSDSELTSGSLCDDSKMKGNLLEVN
jgi:hypothetical protein